MALPDSRPMKPLLLDLAYNTSEEMSFAGTPMKPSEVELVAAGLPSTRILETYGAPLVALDLSRCNISSKGVQLLGAALVANDTLRKVCARLVACQRWCGVVLTRGPLSLTAGVAELEPAWSLRHASHCHGAVQQRHTAVH